MAYRNPSPPPDIASSRAEDEDQISETVLSKSWLLSVMVKTVENTKYRRAGKQAVPNPPPSDQLTAGELNFAKLSSR